MSFEAIAPRALIYLIPSVAVGCAMLLLSRRFVLFSLLMLSGTAVHETLHLFIGILVGARPVAISVWPRRVASGGYVLGSVSFANLRWWNALPAALAPLLAIAGIGWIAVVRGSHLQAPTLTDIALWLALAPQLLSCWPSSTDWKLSLRSWPLYAALLSLVWLAVKIRLVRI